MIKAYAAQSAGGKLESFEYDPGQLGAEEVEIEVEYCGICHSDLSMLNNEWGITEYPFVPGHEVIGTITEVGNQVKRLKPGQHVGLGWYAQSCMVCEWCMSGDHNLCRNAVGTIVGRYGGFADRVRAHEAWVIPLPSKISPEVGGPLFCGGITVFNPIVQLNIQPTDRVGVIGIGGLGHMALQFLNAWGCEVTAFSSSPSKAEEAKKLGADHFVNSKDQDAMSAIAGTMDVIICTANADLDWDTYIQALRPKGRLHFVGVAPNPISTHVFPLIDGQKSISASPLGSPATVAKMLSFAARHDIAPVIEVFSFDRVNEALHKLKTEKPPYRLVLKH